MHSEPGSYSGISAHIWRAVHLNLKLGKEDLSPLELEEYCELLERMTIAELEKFQHLVEERTGGGLTEQAMEAALDRVMRRLREHAIEQALSRNTVIDVEGGSGPEAS